MGKHSNGRRSGHETVDGPAEGAPQPVTATVNDAPAPVAFSGWLPPPPADRAAQPAPAPVVFSAAPTPLEVMAAPVTPVAARPTVPAARPATPAVPALAEAFAAGASSSWQTEPTTVTSALELLAGAASPAAPRPAPVLEPLPAEFERPSQLLAPAVPSQAPAPSLPPVPSFRVDEASTVKVPDLVTADEETRREIARSHRTRKIGKAGGIAIVVGALVAAGVVGLVADRERPRAHHALAVTKPVRTQRTLLFALADPGGDEAALLAADPKAGTSTVTLLPSRVVTNVAGQGQVPLGRAVALPDATVAAGSISDLLGVDVDGSWRVTPGVLAAFIDSLGGITADVDTDVVAGGEVIIRAGNGQHLSGADAVAYAQYLATGEDETARLARLQKVLSGILTELPAQGDRLTSGIGALGATSETTLTPAALATELDNVASGNKGAAVAGPMFSILPVTTLDSGGATPAYRVDPVAMASYVSQNLAASVPAGARAGGVRVYVYSGTLQFGLGTAARRDLVNAGLSFVGSANQATPSTDPSVVLVPDGTDASRAMGLRVAKAMGLPASSVEVSNVPQDVADVIVIAGSDFRF